MSTNSSNDKSPHVGENAGSEEKTSQSLPPLAPHGTSQDSGT